MTTHSEWIQFQREAIVVFMPIAHPSSGINIRWFIVSVCLVFASLASLAEAPSPRILKATFLGLAEKGKEDAVPSEFSYKNQLQWVKRVSERGVVDQVRDHGTGILNWAVPETEFSTFNLGRSFIAYNIDAPITANPDKTYHYDVLPFSPPHPEIFGLKDDALGREKADIRGRYIRELYGRHYAEGLTDANASRAFQAALWELVHETDPAPFDLKRGAFSYPALAKKGPAAKGLDHLEKAQSYLTALTGNDDGFYAPNRAWKNAVLVRLKGIPNPDQGMKIGPSLLAFQFVSASDAAGSYGISANALAGAGPTGSTGANGAGGGGDSGSIGNGTSLGTPSSSTSSQTPTTETNSTGVPGAPPSNTTPPPPPTNPNNSNTRQSHNAPQVVTAPAPPGLVLGLVAVGVWLVRNRVRRAVPKN